MNRAGYTLKEVVLVAMVIIVGLMLLAPFLLQQRAMARRNSCEFRQIKTATAIFAFEELSGGFPGYRDVQNVDSDGTRRPIGFVFQLLPFLDVKLDTNQEGPWARLAVQFGPGGPRVGETPDVRIPALICSATPPKQVRNSQLHWVVNAGMPDATTDPPDWAANGIFLDRLAGAAPRVTMKYVNDHDGANATLLLSENVDAGVWTDDDEPLVGFLWVDHIVNGQPDPGERLLRINRGLGEGDASTFYARPSSYHVGGVNVVYASGKSTFLSEETDYLVLVHLMTPNSRELKQPGGDQPVDPPFRLVVDQPADDAETLEQK